MYLGRMIEERIVPRSTDQLPAVDHNTWNKTGACCGVHVAPDVPGGLVLDQKWHSGASSKRSVQVEGEDQRKGFQNQNRRGMNLKLGLARRVSTRARRGSWRTYKQVHHLMEHHGLLAHIHRNDLSRNPGSFRIEDRIVFFFTHFFIFRSQYSRLCPNLYLSVDTKCYGFLQSMGFERGYMQGALKSRCLKIHGHSEPLRL